MRRKAILAAVGVTALSAGALAAGTHAVAAPKSAALGGYKHLVVIYEENHSFDNLFGLWGQVGQQKVNGLPASTNTQVDQNGNPITCLPQNDANLVTNTSVAGAAVNPEPKWFDGTLHQGLLSPQCSGTTVKGATYDSHFTSSAPFSINDYISPSDKTCAPETNSFALPNGVEKTDTSVDPVQHKGAQPGGCTRDLVHRFYQEQYQLDGGKQDRYTTGSDAIGLTQGYYDSTQLPVYQYLHAAGAPNYVIADNFFQGAFGGSFLNHQYLVAAAAPKWDDAQKPVPAGKNSVIDSAGFPNSGYPLYKADPNVKYNDAVLTQACGLPTTVPGFACGNYGVNTMQPSWQPSSFGSNVLPGINDVDPSKPNYETNIGDELSAKNVSWNWYSGGWDNAAGNVGGKGWTNGSTPGTCTDPNHSTSASVYPYCPDALFQFHHQPLNYFQNYAPGMPGRSHLKDEADFLDSAADGSLPAVSFIKPVGEENEHPGYASTDNGESHLVDLIKAIQNGKDGKDTLIVVTYDEFGGASDHVAPPGQGADAADGPSDQFGPGTRIPALIIGGHFSKSGVDHQSHDTTSILATIEHAYGLAPLGTRDAAVTDLRHALIVGGDDK